MKKIDFKNDVCVGRKEIVALFKEYKLISEKISDVQSWIYICKWKRTKKSFPKLFHRLPNGKPMVLKSEILAWIHLTDHIARQKYYKEKHK
jgi:hypothetical protein